jgi:hypothetical protein
MAVSMTVIIAYWGMRGRNRTLTGCGSVRVRPVLVDALSYAGARDAADQRHDRQDDRRAE